MLQQRIAAGRRKRFEALSNLIRQSPGPVRVLDLGGTFAYWSAYDWQSLGPIHVTLLNLTAEPVPEPFTSTAGDARDLSAYADQSFEVVHAHSVIGHVGSLLDQARMACEIQRVGQRYLVQTPNHHFPLDWRTLTPCFHWLTPAQQAWCFRHFPVGVYHRARDPQLAEIWSHQVRNLTPRELKGLFPGARVVPERVLGLTKSLSVSRP